MSSRYRSLVRYDSQATRAMIWLRNKLDVRDWLHYWLGVVEIRSQKLRSRLSRGGVGMKGDLTEQSRSALDNSILYWNFSVATLEERDLPTYREVLSASSTVARRQLSEHYPAEVSADNHSPCRQRGFQRSMRKQGKAFGCRAATSSCHRHVLATFFHDLWDCHGVICGQLRCANRSFRSRWSG